MMRWHAIFHAIGLLLTVFAGFLAIPLLGSVLLDDATVVARLGPISVQLTTVAYAASALIILAVGWALRQLGSSKGQSLRDWDALYVVGVGWFLCALLGGIPFLLAKVTADPTVALFESMSGITTTGFTALPGRLEDYPPSVHLWRATLQFAGGMGLVVIAVALISQMTEGGRRMMAGETGRDDIQLHPTLSHTARSLFYVYLFWNAVFFIGFMLAMHYTGLHLGWTASAYHAAVHAMAGVATGGYSSLSDSIAGFHSTTVAVVAITCMVAGGFSFPLYLRLRRGQWTSVMRMSVVRFYLALLIVPAVGASLWLASTGLDASEAVLHGTFMTVSSLVGEGFTTTDAGRFPPGLRLVLLILMITGGMVGSTSGAVKQGRILLFLRMVMAEIRKLLHPRAVVPVRMGGQIIATNQINRMVAFFASYVGLFTAGAVLFTLIGFDLESALAGSASTLGNVGYAWDGFAAGYVEPVGPMTRLAGILLMWFGRLEIFAAVVIFLPATYRTR